ncbi:MAG: hypothetical protein ABIS30_07150 [Gallionella sp.]|jgi:hypothetical protein
MNIFRFASLIILLSVAPSALASECGQPISVDAVAKLTGPITLGGLKAKLGEWCQGHGPVSTYKDTNGNEIWFFWKATNHPASNDAERMEYQVLLASVVPKNDPGDYQIIWPPEFVGKVMQDVLAVEYDPQKNKSK